MGDQRFGLLVANSDFASESISRLLGPPVDVASLADVLRRVDIGGFQIETLVNCYRTMVEEAIQDFFGERKRDDVALLYFAGHGLKNDKGHLYFAMKETKRRRLEATALSSRFIHEMMQNSSARRQVLILDCCFSGAFPKGFTFKADESIDSGHYFDAGSGQLILTACDEMQYAFEGDDLTEKNVTSSVFTGILIDGFKSGNADVDLDGQISFKDVYEYAVAEVRSRGSAQVPQRWHFGLDDLILASNPNQGVKALAEELRIRIESSDARVKLQAAYELGELARTSGGRRAFAVRQGLEKLSADDSRAVSDFAKAILGSLPEPPRPPAPVPHSTQSPTGPPRIAVLAPSEGERFDTGTIQKIRWKAMPDGSEPTVEGIELELWEGATMVERLVGRDMRLAGERQSFDWTVPATLNPRGQYRIRVIAWHESGQSGEDFSGVFSVTKPQADLWSWTRSMLRKLKGRVAALLALALLVIVCAIYFFGFQPTEPKPIVAIEQLKALTKRTDEAFTNGDAAALAALYTDDAVLMNDKGPIYGREAIEKYWADLFKQYHFIYHLDVADQKSPHSLGSTGNEAWSNGEWAVTFQYNGGPPTQAKGYWLKVYRHQGDTWKTCADAGFKER
jgi:ketosteroid isomerase-like protein